MTTAPRPSDASRDADTPKRRMVRLLAPLLVVVALVSCGPRYTPPEARKDQALAARASIAATRPAAASGRSAAEDSELLAAVAVRIDAAAQPICTAHLRRPCNVKVFLDASGRPNAEARSRDRVVVTAGLMRLLGDADEVAAVVGHEVGHHLAGHLTRQLVRGTAVGTAASAALGAVVPFGGLAAWALGQAAAELGAGAVRLAYSKEEEREADYLGAYLVARAGYDVDRAGQVWAALTQPGSPETSGLLDSHPAGPDRLAAWQRTSEEIRASPDLMPRRAGH